ncbi:MAG TPA: sulfatase [Candidatus Polarisedimenticolia bacterium]|nr:sulfatase [Candidatus Polarisedimenticolia bacterium]
MTIGRIARPGSGPHPGRLLVATALLSGLLAACGSRPAPNVLLVVIDTARADRFSFDGYRRDTSPRIAALAREGAVYERACTPAPWTLPAHASLFTGLFPSRHGADSGHLRLDDDLPTLAEAFRGAGYRTLGYAANPWVGRQYRLDRGFDSYEEIWRQVHGEEEDAGATRLNARVDRWLTWRDGNQEARRQPFFLFVNYLEPHLPYNPPEPERSAFLTPPVDAAAVERLRRFKHPEEVRYILGLTALAPGDLRILSDLYDGEIAYADRRVGELVDLLRRRALLDRTVVVITSDHGEEIGEHGFLDHKMNVYDPLLRIPLVLRYPPAVPAGQRIADPVMLQDLFPTLLGLAGIETPARAPRGATAVGPREAVVLPGVRGLATVSPRLGGGVAGAESTPPGGAEPIVAEFARPVQFLEVMREVVHGADLTPFERTLVAWRSGDEKLHWSSDGRHRLYDLARDPAEENDLAPQHPERVAALAAQVEAWLRRPVARPPLAQPPRR